MDVQLYMFINGAWKEYNPKPASHTHTIANITNLQTTLNKKIEALNATVVSGDCNNPTTTSIYQGSWTYNRPSGASSYGTLITTQTAHGNSNYSRQIYLTQNSTRMYTRYKTTTWQAWQQIGTMSLSGTTLNITL